MKRTSLLCAFLLAGLVFMVQPTMADDPTPNFNFGDCISNAAVEGMDGPIVTLLELFFGVEINSMRDLLEFFAPFESNTDALPPGQAEKFAIACSGFAPP